jgi:Ca2+-binding EF-hand superfamily protein
MGGDESRPDVDENATLARETMFTQAELAGLRETFNAAAGVDGNRGLSLDEFRQIFQFKSPDLASRFFTAFESKLGSEIAFYGFVKGVHALSSRSTVEQRARLYFNVYDADHNGLITREEFSDIVRLSSIERDSGPLPTAQIQRTVTEVYRRVDTDGNGVMTWDEFLAESTRNPSIMAAIEVDIDRLTAPPRRS